MKIKNVIIATFSVALLASCGGTDACSCIETAVEMGKEVEKANGDEAKLKDIEESYKSDIDACTELSAERAKEMEGMSDDEREAKSKEFEAELEDCDAYKEMMK
ncbi:MAG: hypothetical protein HRT57_10165 [Crocinitomicaceae bacterium]|nr:hypothetical protein [Crocinitomicaceae bacterium]